MFIDCASKTEYNTVIYHSYSLYEYGKFTHFENLAYFSCLKISNHLHVNIPQGIATIFILCESRTKALYRAIWEKVIELAPALQHNVKFIMGDYEKAAITALSEFFPTAEIHGCWFHFNQVYLQHKS